MDESKMLSAVQIPRTQYLFTIADNACRMFKKDNSVLYDALDQ